jgi:hypothetical protein
MAEAADRGNAPRFRQALRRRSGMEVKPGLRRGRLNLWGS